MAKGRMGETATRRNGSQGKIAFSWFVVVQRRKNWEGEALVVVAGVKPHCHNGQAIF
jgi:hypothetical protein